MERILILRRELKDNIEVSIDDFSKGLGETARISISKLSSFSYIEIKKSNKFRVLRKTTRVD